MVFSQKCGTGPSLTFLRSICIHSVLECNHYKSLGLSPSATRSEIKSAYYELSKKHHPDKNQGSEKSAKIFKDITAAYEILGNEKSRKQYDKENFFNIKQQPNYKTNFKSDYSDEIERMFYERKRKTFKRYNGKTQYYDFYSWYRSHYGEQFKFDGNEFEVKPRRMYKHSDKKTAENIYCVKEKFTFVFYIVTLISLIVAAKQMLCVKK